MAVTNYHKPSSSAQVCCNSGGLSGLKSRCGKAIIPFWRLRKESISLLFPASRRCPHSLAHGLFLYLQSRLSPSHMTSLWHWPFSFFFSLIRAAVITLSCQDNPGSISHLKILYWIISAKLVGFWFLVFGVCVVVFGLLLFLPCKWTYSKMLGIRR